MHRSALFFAKSSVKTLVPEGKTIHNMLCFAKNRQKYSVKTFICNRCLWQKAVI